MEVAAETTFKALPAASKCKSKGSRLPVPSCMLCQALDWNAEGSQPFTSLGVGHAAPTRSSCCVAVLPKQASAKGCTLNWTARYRGHGSAGVGPYGYSFQQRVQDNACGHKGSLESLASVGGTLANALRLVFARLAGFLTRCQRMAPAPISSGLMLPLFASILDLFYMCGHLRPLPRAWSHVLRKGRI